MKVYVQPMDLGKRETTRHAVRNPTSDIRSQLVHGYYGGLIYPAQTKSVSVMHTKRVTWLKPLPRFWATSGGLHKHQLRCFRFCDRTRSKTERRHNQQLNDVEPSGNQAGKLGSLVGDRECEQTRELLTICA